MQFNCRLFFILIIYIVYIFYTVYVIITFYQALFFIYIIFTPLKDKKYLIINHTSPIINTQSRNKKYINKIYK